MNTRIERIWNLLDDESRYRIVNKTCQTRSNEVTFSGKCIWCWEWSQKDFDEIDEDSDLMERLERTLDNEK